MARRVVITGMGAVTPIGIGLREYWEGLLEGRNGVGPITLFDPSDYPTRIAAEVKEWDPARFIDRKRARLMARGTHGVAAALMALEDAQWDEHPGDGRLGVVGGVATSPQDAIEDAVETLQDKGYGRSSPFTLLKCFANSAASETGFATGFQEKVLTISTACTSGLNAVGEAFAEIRAGKVDAMLCVGTDSLLSKYVYAYFCRAGLLSMNNEDPEHASRPFDAKRDGGVLGEGGGCLMIESLDHAKRRGARIRAEILGFGSTAIGNTRTPEYDTVRGISNAMREAFAVANVSPFHIDYVGCHGCSDPRIDIWETQALKHVFGDHAFRVSISSVKSMIGIPTCAAGTLQLIATVLGMEKGIVAPTTNYEYPDPECDLDYVPNVPRHILIRRALVYAHGLGGNDSSVVLKRGSAI
ncbi:MAG: beta-ketoacyl-[acyl-carrier-protein] synthase II [Kiritimatiellaeota bacterium]|nr:beta-ketoacyl-[acyl-carrier-protein] synthase II [Kiritimatiellota bacterium]